MPSAIEKDFRFHQKWAEEGGDGQAAGAGAEGQQRGISTRQTLCNLYKRHLTQNLHSPHSALWHNMTQVHLQHYCVCPCHIASIRRQSASIITKRDVEKDRERREKENIKKTGSNFSEAEIDRGKISIQIHNTANVVKCRPVHLHTLYGQSGLEGVVELKIR